MLHSGAMADESTTPGVSAGTSPASDVSASTALTPATPGQQTGAAAQSTDQSLAPTAATADLATDSGTTDLQSVLSAVESIPADDSDLTTQANLPHYTALVNQRQQLRQLQAAVRDLQPLEGYRSLGSIETLQPKVEYYDLLFSPVTDNAGNALIDPETQTPLHTTRPFIERLDAESPGMVEQLFADLGPYRPLADDGVSRGQTLMQQYFAFLGLDPARLNDYRQIDTLIAATGAVTPEELADIPSEYHAAYRRIPQAIRYNWTAYDDATRMQVLGDYKREADLAAQQEADAREKAALKAAEAQRFAALVAQKQAEYFDTVRQERFAALKTSLAKQVTFSADPATNTVMLWAVGAIGANLLDPLTRFVAKEGLEALGVTLDHTFDETITKFETNAMNKVAYELSGNVGQARVAQTQANDAADQVMAKIAPILLKAAIKMGGQQQAAAAAQAANLATAATARPTAGNGAAPSSLEGILPPGMNPASPEAAQWLANQTGFIRA